MPSCSTGRGRTPRESLGRCAGKNAMGAMAFFQGTFLPRAPFCHGSRGIVHAVLLWLPWYVSMPRHSKSDNATTKRGQKNLLSDHPQTSSRCSTCRPYWGRGPPVLGEDMSGFFQKSKKMPMRGSPPGLLALV